MTNSKDIRKYYSIFINTMATVSANFGAKIVKNIGDSVMYYFPRTADPSNKHAFKNVLECCVTMSAANSAIHDKLKEEHLPPMQYRISADYGKVQIAATKTSQGDDLFGSTVNLCAKINKIAQPSAILIGGDFFQVLKSIPSLSDDYELTRTGEYSIIGMRYSYPLYSVRSKHDKPILTNFTQNPELELLSKDSRYSGNHSRQVEKDIRNSPKVMLVDDDQDILFTFDTFLSTQNITVDSFRDSKEALMHFTQASPNHYDLIILDIRMPNLNGLELYYTLKAIDKDIKILFVSALDASEELLTVLPGFLLENLIKKPVERNYFISTVKRILSERPVTGIRWK